MIESRDEKLNANGLRVRKARIQGRKAALAELDVWLAQPNQDGFWVYRESGVKSDICWLMVVNKIGGKWMVRYADTMRDLMVQPTTATSSPWFEPDWKLWNKWLGPVCPHCHEVARHPKKVWIETKPA